MRDLKMTVLEIVGASALYIIGILIACAISAVVGAYFGKNRELGGLVFVIAPPAFILSVGLICGVFLLGRLTA
jgi:hypothetical protein